MVYLDLHIIKEIRKTRALFEVGAKSSESSINEKLTREKFRINVSGSPNSCLVKIGKQKCRTLDDTGAECSFMHRSV